MPLFYLELGAMWQAFKALLILLLILVDARAEQSTVTIGLIIPATGSRASIGEDSRAGAELAIENLKSHGNTVLELKFEDSQGDPKIAVSAAQKLLADGVRVLVTQNSNVSLATQPIIARAGALQLGISTTSDRYSTDNDLSFRMNGTTQDEARQLFDLLSKVSGKILLATMEDEYPVSVRKHLRSLGFKPAIDFDYSPAETDFRTMLTKANGFSGIVCLGYQTQCGLLAKQLRELGNKAKLYVSTPVNNKEFFVVAGKYAEGALVVYPSPDFNHPQAKKFENKYGRAVNFFSSNAYDGVYLLGLVIKECLPDATPLCISSKLKKIGNYDGLSGHKTINPVNGDMNDSYSVLVAKQGRFTNLNEN